MPNLALCDYILPGPRRCGQPRLRGERHCRFHIRNLAAAEFEERMYHLNDQLEALDLLQLLETLRRKLDGIRCTLRAYPEACLTLTVAIDRLNGLSPLVSMTEGETQQNQSPPPTANDLKRMLESLFESIS